MKRKKAKILKILKIHSLFSVNCVLKYCVFDISLWFEKYWIINEIPTTVQINLKTLESAGHNY